jgi:hypothetical protein
MYSVDIDSRARRAYFKDGMSSREASRYFNWDRKTIAKMLRNCTGKLPIKGLLPRNTALVLCTRNVEAFFKTT